MSFESWINFHKNQKETTLLKCEQNCKKNSKKDKQEIQSTKIHIHFLTRTTKQNNIEPNTQQKKQKKHEPQQTDSHLFFFHFFFIKTTKNKQTKDKEEKYSSNYVRHSLSVCKTKSLKVQSKINFNFFEIVIEAIKYGDTTKALRLISDPKTNLEQTSDNVRNFVVWVFCIVLLFFLCSFL